MTEAAATTGGSVLRGGVWYTAARIVPQFYALAISIVAARFLGPEGMGRQSFIAFVELSVAALLTQGMFLALMRTIGEAVGSGRSEALHGLLNWAWGVMIVAALAGGALIAGAGLAGAEPQSAWLLAGVVCLLATLHSVPSAVLIGVQRWRAASIVGLVTGVIGTAATIAVLAAGGGITGMFAVEAAVSVVNLVFTGALARRALGRVAPRRGAVGELRRRVVAAAAILTLSEILTLVVDRRSEVFFLAHWSTDAQIALYSIVFAVVTALVQVPYTMALAISPAVATLFGAGARLRIRFGYARALRLLLVAAFPLTAAGLSIGPPLLQLIYGDEYAGTRPIMLIMMAVFPLIPAGGLASALLTGLGRLRFLLKASAFAAAVDIALALLLVPRYEATGAALANAGAATILALTLLAGAHSLIGKVRLELTAIARTGLAAAATGVVGWASVAILDDAVGVVVGALAGTAVFASLAAALRILPRRDAEWLDATVGRHFGGLLGRYVRSCAS